MPRYMGIREYARHRGVHPSSVQCAIRSGRITRREDGKIAWRTADREWVENTDVDKPRSSLRRVNLPPGEDSESVSTPEALALIRDVGAFEPGLRRDDPVGVMVARVFKRTRAFLHDQVAQALEARRRRRER